MDNMKLWNNVKQPPPEALKPIQAGRLKGKTDINPQWRIQKATEEFGPCGIGWKYEITSYHTLEAPNGEIAAQAEILLYVKIDGEWTAPIPGVGGSMFVRNESNGPYTNDEAYKMATTDALSVAFKALGFGADIYLGRWDGSKYTEHIDESALRDWETACKDAASGSTVEDFKEWWPSVKSEVMESLGEAGAAKIYQVFKILLDRKRVNEHATATA